MPDNVVNVIEARPQSLEAPSKPVIFGDVLQIVQTPKHYSELVQEFLEKPQPQGKRLEFQGEDLEGKDVYNPTAPIRYQGKRFLAARVESRISELDSKIMFFEENGKDNWRQIEGSPVLKLQDPSITTIEAENGRELILAGVEVTRGEDGGIDYKTVFYRDYGQGLNTLEKFAEGPNKMKDIRPVQMQDGRMCVFTRPQGEFNGVNYGSGKICYSIINDINQLNNPESYKKTELIDGLFAEGEWGGVNAAYALPNGNVGIICHISSFDENKNKYYAAASFCINPVTGEITMPLKIIATAENAPECLSKFENLKSEVFPGGIEETEDGTVDAYCGKLDTTSTIIPLYEHPFSQSTSPVIQAA